MIGIFVTPRRRKYKPAASGEPDVTAPVITGLTIDAGQQEMSFTSDEAGACHWVLDGTNNYADADALVAAKPAGEASGSGLAVLGPNTSSFDSSGVDAGVWRLHVGVIDAAGNASNVLSGDVTVSAAGLAMDGDPLTWDGDQLIFNAA